MNLTNTSLDRRQKLRKVPNEFSFLQLERDDGGAVVDASEEGLRFETFAPVHQDGPVYFWFSLNLRDRIEGWGELVWTNTEKKSGGLKFMHISEEGRARIREWIAESSAQHASDETSGPRSGPDRTPAKIAADKLDAGTAFGSKTSPQYSTLFAGGQNSGNSDALAPRFQEMAEQALGFVPVQKYLAAMRKQLILGMLLGSCISATIAVSAFEYSNYRRQTRDMEMLAGESREARLPAELQAATPATSNPVSGDIPSTGNQKKGTSSSNASHNQKAAGAGSPSSQLTEPSGSTAPTLTSFQPRSSENVGKKERSRTPAQLWASVQAGNSKAAVELAELYIQGDAVPRNCMQARVLLLVASEKRNAAAIRRLQELDKTGCPGE